MQSIGSFRMRTLNAGRVTYVWGTHSGCSPTSAYIPTSGCSPKKWVQPYKVGVVLQNGCSPSLMWGGRGLISMCLFQLQSKLAKLFPCIACIPPEKRR